MNSTQNDARRERCGTPMFRMRCEMALLPLIRTYNRNNVDKSIPDLIVFDLLGSHESSKCSLNMLSNETNMHRICTEQWLHFISMPPYGMKLQFSHSRDMKSRSHRSIKASFVFTFKKEKGNKIKCRTYTHKNRSVHRRKRYAKWDQIKLNKIA